jgi:DNA (cytosine-5)-methyltransferase 1
VSGIIVDGFGGPGGWAEALRRLGLPSVGIELDEAACATRRAAGHHVIRADMSRFPVERLAGKVTGATFSAPCTTFSAAGDRAGTVLLEILAASVRDAFAGRRTRAARRREMAAALRQAGWPKPGMPKAASYMKIPRRFHVVKDAGGNERAVRKRWKMTVSAPAPMDVIWAAVRSASLVVEPARFIHACRPEWVAMEQVPAVLPLWKVYAEELRKLGYSVWYGKLNAADYGVPQTRIRAILIASRVRRVQRPMPTHYDPGKGMQLFGSPWVSMTEALGFGASVRPSPTVTAGGTATGGAEPFGRSGRDALETEQQAGRWVLQREVGASRRDGRRPHELDEPAPAITGGGSAAGSGNGAGLRWVLHTNRDQREDGQRQTADPQSAPALTAKSGGQWVVKSFRNNNNNNACTRGLDEPAGTLFFGGRSNWAAWTVERPATTVQGDPRIGRPGHKDRDKGEAQFEVDSVRITVEQAAVLQSFPPGYPWQGSKTAQFRQCGDAMPPLLAEHVLAMAAGIAREQAAA